MVYGDASIMVGRRGVGGMGIRRESERAMEREEEENGRQKVSERMGKKKGSKGKYLMGPNLIHPHPVPVSGLCFFKILTISGVQVAVDGHFFIAAFALPSS